MLFIAYRRGGDWSWLFLGNWSLREFFMMIFRYNGLLILEGGALGVHLNHMVLFLGFMDLINQISVPKLVCLLEVLLLVLHILLQISFSQLFLLLLLNNHLDVATRLHLCS